MPGLAGWISPEVNAEPLALLGRMAAEIKYADGQRVHTHLAPPLYLAYVDYGEKGPPMASSNEDGTVRLWMHGEVFGFHAHAAEMARRGHAFADLSSGPEYCVHLYEEKGADFVKDLNGTFAIVLYDTRSGAVLLAVDRAGARPLYHHVSGEALVFGTSVRSVFHAAPGPARTYDDEAIAELFLFEAVKKNHTLCRGVHALPVGSIGTWRNGAWSVARYHEMRFDEKRRESIKDGAREFAELLRQAVRRRTSDGRSYGVFLSGGVDSRTVLAAAETPVTALTMGEGTCRELAVAQRIAEAAGVRHVVLHRDGEYYAHIVEDAALSADSRQRYTDAHAVGLQDQIRQAGVDTVLAGSMFDALFKGFFLVNPRALARAGQSDGSAYRSQAERAGRHLVEVLCEDHPSAYVMGVLSPRLREAARRVIEQWVSTFAEECDGTEPATHFEWLERQMTLDIQDIRTLNFGQANLQQFLDRSPAFDGALLDFACTMPHGWKRHARCVRRALWVLNKRIARVPEAGTGVPVCIAPPFDRVLRGGLHRLRRAKRRLGLSRSKGETVFTDGSWHNLNALIRQSELMQRKIREAIRQLGDRFLDVPAAEALLGEHLAGKGNHRYLFEIILTLASWDRDYGS